MNFLIVTGMSGAGKTCVANILEDLGYYCIDNIPSTLLTQFVELYTKQENKSQQIALVVDVRSGENFEQLLGLADSLKKSSEHNCKIIFLDAKNDVLINRYKETRHVHPFVLSKKLSLDKAIDEERLMLSEIKKNADHVIDTTFLKINRCRDQIIGILGNNAPNINISCISFGFKYGTPSDVDLLFDVRCFPNPFYVESLREHSGLEKCVYDYVMSHTETQTFVNKLFDMIDYLIPLYIEDGRSHLTIAIGCTGGHHRSVAIAEALAEHINMKKAAIASTVHRDIQK